MEKLISRKEAAKLLGISIATLDAARNSGLGWILKRDVWGKGYASILTKMLIAECRKLRKGAIIECDPRQAVTEHIAKKHGFKFSGKRDGCDVYKLEE